MNRLKMKPTTRWKPCACRRYRRWTVLASILPLFATVSHGETSLWEVTSDNGKLYLGGTIHVLRQSDYPLPAAYQQAFEEAELIGFETDLRQINSVSFQTSLLQKARYPGGESLADHLSEDAMGALQRYCRKAGVSIDALLPFKPAVAMLTILTLELSRLDAATTGVDNYFMQRAQESDKPVLGLETAEEQLDYLIGMGVGEESAFILHSLQDLEQLDSMLQQMIEDWRSGDTRGLNQLFIAPMAQQYPDIYQSLLVQRNQDWLPKIEQLLATEATELVLVGVAHLVGEDGLIEVLQARGYRVQQR